MNLGLAYWTTARYPESAEAFQQALHIDPNNVTALNGLGIAQFHMGQREQGIQSVKQAVKVNPGFVDGHLNLARWYHGMGRYEEAAAAYTQVTKIILHGPRLTLNAVKTISILARGRPHNDDKAPIVELTDRHLDEPVIVVMLLVQVCGRCKKLNA